MRRAPPPVKDQEALARVLAALGQTRIANNLNQLARAVNIGVLPEAAHDPRRQPARARELAIHLMKPEIEHIEVHEIRGFVAGSIIGALREAEAVSRGTRCPQFLYFLSLSPPETESAPMAVFEDALGMIEIKRGLIGHPRVVVFHEKQGRRHAHCVWSRINAEIMTAVRMSHDRRKLGDVSRQLYMEQGWKMPEGLIDPELRNPLNFDRKEWFQAQRAGKDPRDIKAALQRKRAA